MVTVRLATQNDIPSMRDLISQSVERGEVLPRTLQELTDLLPTFFVAESTENRIVGTAALEVYSQKLAEIRSLCIPSRCPRRGNRQSAGSRLPRFGEREGDL